MSEQTTEAPPWFQIDARRYPFAWFPGTRAPVTLASAFDERILPLALDQLARPHVAAARERLELECREVADMLAKVCDEDGHAGMLASVLQALVLRIAEGSES